VRYFPLRLPWRFAGRVGVGVLAMLAVLYPLTRWWEISQAAVGWGEKLLVAGKLLLLALLGALIFWAVLKALGGLTPEGKKRLAELKFPFKKIVLKLL
jgi:hypothetical protein